MRKQTAVRTARFPTSGAAIGWVLLVLCFCASASSQSVPAAPTLDAPAGHESSSGVAVAGGGFITVTAVWVTPGLTASAYYQQWVRDAGERLMHRGAAATYTVMLLELANRSLLTLEGYVSVNVRLWVEGERVRPLADENLARTFPALMPSQHLERIGPGEALTRAYAFPQVSRTRVVTFIVRPLRLVRQGQRFGQLQEFELRFDSTRLVFPP